MRPFHTLVCSVIAAITCAGSAIADEPEAQALTSAQLLEQSPRDKRIWLDAAMTMTVHVVGSKEPAAGRCIAAWYYDGDGAAYAEILATLKAYPDHRPTTVLIAMIDDECGGIRKPAKDLPS